MKIIRWWLSSITLALAAGGFFHVIDSSYAAPSTRALPSTHGARVSCPVGRVCPQPVPRPGTVARPAPVPPRATACPPGTVYDSRIGRCVSACVPPPSSGPMRPVPSHGYDPDEVSATNLVNAAMRGLNCSQAGDALRRLSNQVLSLAASATTGGRTGSRPPPSRGDLPSTSGDDFKERWRQHIRSPQFWMKVWNKMADAYRSCNRTCFDDGVAVGEISATAYCSASVALEGLPGIGYLEQPPLPVCETAIHVGCLQSYQRTAREFNGCSAYTEDTFSGIFAEYQSQDCHL